MLDLTGVEHALTMLRQGVAAGGAPEFGALLVKLFELHGSREMRWSFEGIGLPTPPP